MRAEATWSPVTGSSGPDGIIASASVSEYSFLAETADKYNGTSPHTQEVRRMNVGMVQNVMAADQSEAMALVGLLVQKKAMDVAKLQGQMLQEMMASMGIGQNLDVRG